MFCFVESFHETGIDMHGVYVDIKHKVAVLERMTPSVVLRGKVPTQMAFFESFFSGECDCLLTSYFCGLSKFFWTDTTLNDWSAWTDGLLRVVFLIDDYSLAVFCTRS